jgi:FkbM family methyltransferase
MVQLRSAINFALRRTTGYHLTKLTVPTTPAEALKRMGYRLHDLNDSALVATRKGTRDVVIDKVDRTTWVLQQRGADRREVVALGRRGLRTHLLIDKRAARAQMSKVQRQTGSYLAHEQISAIMSKQRINCVFDVGANVGQYAQRLRTSGYRGRIVSFEPVPHLAAELRAKAESDHDWQVFECALGEEEGSAEINAVPDAGTMSSLLPTSEFGRSWSADLSNVRTETISVTRLDSVFDKATEGIRSPRIYLKMDTQGFDLQAFRGAGDRLGDVSALQSEVACLPIYEGMPRLPEMLAVYEAAGFEIAGMYPVNFHRRTLRVIEFDMLMIRAQRRRKSRRAEPAAQ